MATPVLLFPLVRFILLEIGLPWLTTARKYSELQRRRVEDWVDRKAAAHGFDPDQVEAASRELVAELERTTGADARSQWEQVEKRLQSNSEEQDPSDPGPRAWRYGGRAEARAPVC